MLLSVRCKRCDNTPTCRDLVDRYLLQKLRANATWSTWCEQRSRWRSEKFLVNLPAIRWIDGCMRRWEWRQLTNWTLCTEVLRSGHFLLSLARLLYMLFSFFSCFFCVLNQFWIAFEAMCFPWTLTTKSSAKLNLASWQLHMPIGCSTILIRVEGSDGLRFSCSVFLGFSFLFWILLASWQPWHMTKDENVHFLANSDAWKLRSYCNGLIIPKWQSDASARNCYALPEQRLRSLMRSYRRMPSSQSWSMLTSTGLKGIYGKRFMTCENPTLPIFWALVLHSRWYTAHGLSLSWFFPE